MTLHQSTSEAITRKNGICTYITRVPHTLGRRVQIKPYLGTMMPAVRIEISIRKMSVLILQSPSRSGSLESTNLLTQSREREILIVILVGMQRRFRADDDDDDSATCARKPSHYWIGRKHVNNKVCCQYN